MTATAADDAALARRLAAEAGAVLLELRRSAPSQGAGSDEWQRALRDLADRRAQEVLSQGLREARPGDAVLSEEAADDGTRLAAERVWIIDPLDGTREFAEVDRVDWAVHVALWERGELVLGVVALPGLDEVLGSDAPVSRPAWSGGPARMAVSRTRPPAAATAVAQRLGLELVPMGSAGYKVASVVRGEAEVYLHSGGQYEWDSAAPVALARAAGLHTSRIDGSPLTYNNADVRLPDLLVCVPELADQILLALAEVAA